MTPALFADEPQHALVPLPSEQQCRAIIAKHGLERGTEVLRGLLARRRQIITLAETDPLHHAPRPPWWRLVDRCTRRTESPADRIKLMVLLGGNRSGKTRRCAHGIVKAALGALPCADGNNFLVGSQNLESSIAVAQRAVWHYLPPNIKALNGTRDKARGYFVNYSPKEGFSERVLVLPGNESRIRFETFNNDPADYEGWEFGCRAKYDVAWWFDEDAPWPWIDMAMRRGRFRPGYGMWSFTPINGITPAIREIASAGKVVIQRRAALLPRNRVVVEGCKPGHVPLLAEGKVPNSKVIYVHSDLSPFGSGTETYAESVRKVVAGKPEATILRIYYGYAKDVGGIAPDVAKRLAQELVVRDRVDILAGFLLTPNALAAGDVSAEAKKFMVVMNAATSIITTRSPFMVRTSLTINAAGIADSRSGVGDVYVGPLVLGWHGAQWDAVAAAGMWLDSGNTDHPASAGKVSRTKP